MTLRIKKSPGKPKRSGGGRPLEANREAHKAAVLDAAMAVFLERAFSRARMLDIARRAGPPPQRLYRVLVSEADKFPALAEAFWDDGPGLGRKVLRDYFSAMRRQRRLSIKNVELAAEQFLGALLGPLAVRSALLISSPIVGDHSLEESVAGAVSAFLRAYAIRTDKA